MQEKIKVYAQTPEEAAHFRGKYLIKAEQYFPKLDEWCPPIYISVIPPGGRLETYHYVPFGGSYIYLGEADIIEGWNDFDAQTEFFYHEVGHVFEMKFMGRRYGTDKPHDEKFAQAVHDSVHREDKLLYIVLTHLME